MQEKPLPQAIPTKPQISSQAGRRKGQAGGDDAFLVIDKNNNGNVDDISEMFGNQYVAGFALARMQQMHMHHLTA